MRKMKKMFAGFLTVTMLAGLLTGCGAKTIIEEDDDIELITPVGVAESYITVETRDMYSASVISAMVVPTVSEYSYASGKTFKEYAALPGEKVSVGTELIRSDTSNLDEQIKNLKEQLNNAEKSYKESIDSINEQISDNKAVLDNRQGVLDDLNSRKPKQYLTAQDEADEKENPEYTEWYEAWYLYDGEVRTYSIKDQQLQERLKETKELFELDQNYRKRQLNQVVAQRSDAILSSTMEGELVGVYYDYYTYWGMSFPSYASGEWMRKDQTMAVVGDTDNLVLKCEYIGKSKVNQAESVYAIVDGKRYDVEYQPMDNEEYERLKEKNGTVYSTFSIVDPNKEVACGQYAVIVFIKETREDVVAVPKDAIYSDDNGSFVYVVDGTDHVYTTVKTGLKDGMYVEILSGLNAGDKIISEEVITTPAKTQKLVIGSISNEYSESGVLFYPAAEWLYNPIEYGTTYIDEIVVSKYQKIEKGDTIAKVHVLSNSVEIARQQRNLQRLNEDMEELQKNLKDADARSKKTWEKQIQLQQESIDEVTKYINELKADGNTKEIKATKAGIITDMQEFNVGDILRKDAAIVQISDDSLSYICIPDSDSKLTYGNTATISYTGQNGQKQTATGVVTTMNACAVSKDMVNGSALIKVDSEYASEMAGSNESEGRWSLSSYKVTVQTRSMQNVVLVPKRAVKEVSGSTYVKMLDEDGKARYVSFVAGGSDSMNYWVAEGLSEGMEICLE